MSDGRRNNGAKNGVYQNQGRKPKADEIKLIELLDKHINKGMVIDKLEGLVNEGNIKAIQIYMNYRYGKPKETVDLQVREPRPIIDVK